MLENEPVEQLRRIVNEDDTTESTHIPQALLQEAKFESVNEQIELRLMAMTKRMQQKPCAT